MNRHTVRAVLAAVAVLAFSTAWGQSKGKKSDWQEEFATSSCNMATTGRNPYFVLEPGCQLVRGGGDTKLQITVLNEAKMVEGVNTRAAEATEWEAGKWHEIASTCFALHQ